LDQRSSKRSLADDPQFAASLSALDHGLSRPLEQSIDTIDSLSEAMWSEVAAQWDAFAPAASPRTPPTSKAVVSALYHSAEHDRALGELIACVTRGETVVVVTGERGAGKTTLCRALVEHLDRRTLLSVVTAPASVDALLKRLLVDFGVISNDETARQLESASHEDLSGALRDFLSSLAILHASALVIVHDAHVINPEVWDELSAICDMGDGHRLQMLLVGEPALKRVMRRADVRDMARRVAFRIEVDAAIVAEAANDVGVVRTLASNWRERTLVAAVLVLMLIAGAAGAGWVFREPLNRALAHWRVSDSR